MNYALMNRDLKAHMETCDKRGARLEKLAWTTGGVVLTVLGLLLRSHFNIG